MPLDNYDLYGLVSDFATTDAIRETILRPLKNSVADVRLTSSKAGMIDQLRSLVNRGDLEIIKVFDLLRDSEENGRQRIHYYRVTTNKARELNNVDLVGSKLFGANWKERFATPLLTQQTEGFEVVDFRENNERHHDWTLKIYSFGTKNKLIEKGHPDVNGIFNEKWQTEPTRSILIVRWNTGPNPPLLEVRIPIDSEEHTRNFFRFVWTSIKNVLLETDAAPFPLDAAMKLLVSSRETNHSRYLVHDAMAWDSVSCAYRVNPNDGDSETLDESEHGGKLLKSILDSPGGMCGVLRLNWLGAAGDDSPLRKNLRCVIGGGTIGTLNQVTIGASTTAKAVDYVTNQLRHFSS